MRAGVSAGVARYAATSLVVAAALSADTLSRGHDHYFNLEYDEAIAAYEQAHREEPENPNIPNHLATAILFKELHRLGKLETSAFKGDNDFLLQDKPKPDLEVKRRFEEALAKGRRIAESRLKPNESDRLGLFALAQNYGLEANYEFMIDKSYFAALRDGNRARKYSDRLTKAHPEFVDGYLVAGVQEYVVGSLPWAVKALITLGGIRGDKEKGQQMVARVAEEGNLVRNEARVLLALLYRRERRPLDAAKLIEGLIEEFPRNYVLHLELAGMYADADNKPRALEIFRHAREMVLSDEHRFGRMPPRLRDALDRRIDALEQEQSTGSGNAVAD